MYLLDTNVLSELRPGKPQASPAVWAWAASVPHGLHFISAITVLEQEIGVLLMERRDPRQGAALRAWWGAVRQAFEPRTLSYGGVQAVVNASMHVPDKKSFRDSMIAATALTHGFVLVTRNVADFAGIRNLRLLDPWRAEEAPS